MKRVLIVSPNWPPLTFPDMHRVRIALPYFAENGWEPLILKIDPNEQQGTRDPQLAASVLAGTRVWQAGCIPRSWTRWFGLNHAGIRSLIHLARLGDAIIEQERPALVFFSTTMFPVFILGRYWLRKHAIAYVLDFQDPWVAQYGDDAGKHGGWKWRVSQWIARILEPLTVRKAAHIVCVSPEYPRMLLDRYPDLPQAKLSVLPFGGAAADFDVASKTGVAEAHLPRADGKEHWVYVGRGGSDMALALRGFFLALAQARAENPAKYGNVRVHFIGTDYASGAKATKTIEPLATACGVGDLVDERPERIPYFDALRYLKDADALIVPGSQDPAYTASKIYPYILADRPMLALVNERSSVVEVLQTTGAATLVTFSAVDAVEDVANRVHRAWFHQASKRGHDTNWEAFEAYSARSVTRRLCGCFDAALRACG